MANIYQQDLDFLAEAKRAFEGNARWETYRNDENTRIALREGPDRDCIQIYELGREVMFANNIMDVAPELVVKTERPWLSELDEGDVVIGTATGTLAIFIKHHPEHKQVSVQIRNGCRRNWDEDKFVLYAKKGW